MSILQYELPDARVLDLFAGSGALGLEALSRGAARAEFVEVSARNLVTLRENAESLGAGGTAILHRGDAVRFAQRLLAGAFDVAFADPPYRLGLAHRIAEQWLAVPFARTLSLEHASSEVPPAGGETRRYGDTSLTFYRVSE